VSNIGCSFCEASLTISFASFKNNLALRAALLVQIVAAIS